VVLAIAKSAASAGRRERLGWSQPKVSIALNKLRAALGDPLFIRTTHGMRRRRAHWP
jgi:DNA-binding transcriptional LysR family regulator